MIYTIHHTCGHTQQHKLFGPGSDRARKIEWLKTTTCTACWRAEQDKQRAQATAAAITYSQKHQLPLLEGTDKQIAWAMTLRDKIIRSLDLFIVRFTESDRADELAQMMRKAIPAFREHLLAQTASRWWIDNRNKTIDNLWSEWVRTQPELVEFNRRRKEQQQ